VRSALYQGVVEHRRLAPRAHAFRYRLGLFLLDLDELPAVFRGRWLWSLERANVVRFRRADYLGPSAVPLRKAVLDEVERALGRRPDGALTLLTQLRTFGYLFNPVSFYFCHAAGGALEAVVAEITNTPWNERHRYVLDARGREELVWRFPKRFHVSPFLPMELEYEWHLTRTPARIEIAMRDIEHGLPVFQARLSLARRELGACSLAGALLRFPLQTLRVPLAIYWQAARLWLKRTPFHPHPASAQRAGARTP